MLSAAQSCSSIYVSTSICGSQLGPESGVGRRSLESACVIVGVTCRASSVERARQATGETGRPDRSSGRLSPVHLGRDDGCRCSPTLL